MFDIHLEQLTSCSHLVIALLNTVISFGVDIALPVVFNTATPLTCLSTVSNIFFAISQQTFSSSS